jgi:hypothetical protein
VRGGQRNAGIHGGLIVGRRLGPHQLLNQIEQGRLLAPRAGQQRAHGDGESTAVGISALFSSLDLRKT